MYAECERPGATPLLTSPARGSSELFHYLENGYIAQPIPTPIRRNNNNDQMMYFTRSFVRRRLRNPNAIEMSSANSVIA